MKKVIGLIIVMLVLCSCEKTPEEKAQDRNIVARERIELLQKAASSTDPFILKQAEMIQQDIENDRTARENEKYALFKSIFISTGVLVSLWFSLWGMNGGYSRFMNKIKERIMARK